MDIIKAFTDNEETANINIQGTVDDPLFQASQIGKLLGIKNIRSTIDEFDEDEIHLDTIYTNKGPRECTFLTEVGLYRLLGMSRKHIARKFQKWVANVIKEIRIKGKYELEGKLKEAVDNNILERELINHKVVIERWKKTSGVYIGKIRYMDDNKMLIKIGSTTNIKKRAKDLKRHFGTFTVLEFFEANNHINFETSLLNDNNIVKYKYEFEVNGHMSDETFSIPKEFYSEIVMMAKRKQKDHQGMSEKYIFELEMKKRELEMLEKQKELELISLQKLQIQNNLPVTIIKEIPLPVPINENRKKSHGSKIQKYTADGQLVCTYNGLIDVVRKEGNGSESGIRKAIERKSLYKEYRWMSLSRDQPDDTIQDIGDTTKIVKQNLKLIAMLDINKQNIVSVFPDQNTAAQSRNLSSPNCIYISIKRGRMCSGHYFCFYDDCSDEQKQRYLENNTLPQRKRRHNAISVKKLHPETLEVIEEFRSFSEISVKHQIMMSTLKQVIDNNTVYKGFRWSY